MTDAEWLACTDPRSMLEFWRGRASARKLRLFGCACCRRASSIFLEEKSWIALEKADGFADGTVTEEELIGTLFGVIPDSESVSQAFIREVALWWKLIMVIRGGNVDAIARLAETVADGARAAANDRGAAWRASPGHEVHAARIAWARAELAKANEQADQCQVIRDLFGPRPCQPTTAGTWLTADVMSLANFIYDHRRFQDMPHLADLLGKAGCSCTDILEHCRSGLEHVRGCWVIDSVLGKD